jgi:hypothetical protein
VYILETRLKFLTSNGMLVWKKRFDLKTRRFDTMIKYRLFSKK